MKLIQVLRAWGRPVIWVHDEDPPARLAATAETVPPVTVIHLHVVRHLHLTPGGDAAGLGLALPPGGATTEGE